MSCAVAQAQPLQADSLWCDNLNNIIRCVSMAQVYEPVGPRSIDTFDIAPFAPQVHLTTTDSEIMQRRYKKVTYTTDLRSTYTDRSLASLIMDQWYEKFKHCLDGWDTARIDNRDGKTEVKDYFITNGEDETTVRISLQRDSAFSDGYHVRITIY
ncbi:MAG: hypothetical protein JSS76_07400 [Bacteroidetes bacterium]|nr:hypothetical protein [Bacteroidota bacterium]